mmetsp:Transcript_53158/g.172893  ORF Transcript_53158/g.172893 Transcript_53158/m.172893 type:complete len:195 (-) Transcript_53158:452-1036(-)
MPELGLALVQRPLTRQARNETVPVLSLRDLLQRLPEVSFLKIDAQGLDLDILLSAEELLDRVREVELEMQDVEVGDPRLLYKGQPTKSEVVQELGSCWDAQFPLVLFWHSLTKALSSCIVSRTRRTSASRIASSGECPGFDFTSVEFKLGPSGIDTILESIIVVTRELCTSSTSTETSSTRSCPVDVQHEFHLL